MQLIKCRCAYDRVSARVYNSHEFKPKINISYQKNMYLFWRIIKVAELISRAGYFHLKKEIFRSPLSRIFRALSAPPPPPPQES